MMTHMIRSSCSSLSGSETLLYFRTPSNAPVITAGFLKKKVARAACVHSICSINGKANILRLTQNNSITKQ